MANDTSPSVPDGQTLPGTDPNGQTPNPPSSTQSGSQKTPIESLPADIQDYIARLRSEAEEANKQKKAEARAKQQADEERMKQRGEFEKLAEQHEARVNELTPIAERYNALAATLHSQIKTQVKDWPDDVKKLVPGDETPIEQRLEQVEKLRPLVEKLTGQTRTPGNRQGPTPTGTVNELNPDALKTELLKSGMYKPF